MGQKVTPIGNRLGYIRGWESSWYAPKKKFGTFLLQDQQLRQQIRAKVPQKYVSKIVIERTIQAIIITIHSSRPGMIIGAGGSKIQELKALLDKKIGQEVRVNVFEVRNAEIDATLVAKDIKEQIEARLPIKRAIKRAIDNAMRLGIAGIKVQVSGRIGGAEIARTEKRQEGRIPLHTLRADIDYALEEASTTYGKLGIKTWVFKQEIYGKKDLSLNIKTNETRRTSNRRHSRGPQA